MQKLYVCYPIEATSYILNKLKFFYITRKITDSDSLYKKDSKNYSKLSIAKRNFIFLNRKIVYVYTTGKKLKREIEIEGIRVEENRVK